ncbi:metal ABC transporter substrate-binding protein [Periweissella cryptocerci]|uniref:Metal ABC transporter substrate-binding protein n=1 Tax=Periweissella cryptocerci TaxID=2506420 RepID=A0A4P6YSN8_9LACO|nr:MetQ/NlpA family ABC transporter substrate-binding protein [Periweissella cryptocerci]QBO35670.1 metal ABC transporter substrate-binding protein [Periweissella cryptocerci]
MKKAYIRFAVIAFALALILAGCGKAKSTSSNITIGSMGSDTDVWRYIAQSKEAKDAGLKITVKDLTNVTSLNPATVSGNIDVNAFQTVDYLNAYNKAAKQNLVPIATTYLEPLGIFSHKYKSLADVKDGATVGIVNDPANEARDLQLLAQSGLIKLAPSFKAGTGSIKDIAANPKHLKFKEIDYSMGPRVLDSLDLVFINNTTALEAGLNVLKDSVYREQINATTKGSINLLVTTKAKAKQADIKKLGKLYHSAFVQKYIKDKFQGTKVDVNKPLSYVEK